MECPECGALDCESRFHQLLALEYADPAYGAVHHLTVTAYMLQHSSRLTREGWLFQLDLLGKFLEGGTTPSAIRASMRRRLDGGLRSFKIKSRTGQPLHGHHRWQRTIRDVGSESPGLYKAEVTEWARSVLVECREAETELHEPQVH